MPRRLQVLLAFAALCLACGSARDRAGAADSGEAAPAAGGAGAAVSGASTATTSSAARAFGAVAGALTATTSSAARSVEGAASAARSVEGAASAAMTATTSSVARGRSAADADHADVAARNPDVADAAVPVPDAPDSAVLAREAPDAAVLAPDAPDATVPDVVSADIADAAVDAAPASADSGGLDEGYAGPYVMVQGETAFDAPPSPNEGGLGFFGQADASAAVALPFAFAYFGKIHPPGTRLFVTSHGTVFIGNGVVEQKNVALPRGDAPYGVIAPFWDSLRFGFDAYATATAHAVDVIWYLAAHADGDAEAVTFKLTLTPSGLVRFTYYYGTSGYSATVGLSDPTGQLVYQLPCSPHCDPTLDVPPGTVISFVPSDATVARRDLAAVGFAPQLPQFVYLGEHLTSGSPVIKNVGWPNLDRRLRVSDFGQLDRRPVFDRRADGAAVRGAPFGGPGARPRGPAGERGARTHDAAVARWNPHHRPRDRRERRRQPRQRPAATRAGRG